MNMNAKGIKRTWILAAALLAIAASACGTTHHYVDKNVPNQVLLKDSQSHSFRYVNVSEERGNIVLYGKMNHHHVSCPSPGHVDVAIVGGGGEVVFQRSIAVVRRGKRNPGWSGAEFRARLPVQLSEDHEVRLAFHDECQTEEVFDCATKQSALAAPVE